jgi:NADPH:quinone reductase-like Zn-dependent oxidoreductase
VSIGTLEKCLQSCASNACVLNVAARPVVGDGGPAGLLDLPYLNAKCLSIKGYTVGSRRMFEDFVRALEKGLLKPVVDRVFGFDQALEAIRYYQSSAKLGKIVISIP